MLSLKIFLNLALLQVFAAAAPIANPQTLNIVPPLGSDTGILNTAVNGPASIYTELQGEPLYLDSETEFEG
jgi:hypothetical protein